jgi:SAM-dependent methyltransferase
VTTTDHDPQESEFGTVAGWTAEALLELDGQSRIIGACRGSGSPAALAWLAESTGVRGGTTLLDVGAGLGGPLAWARDHYDVRAFAAEPMELAVTGSARLFGLDALVARADALPFDSASAQVVWCLAALDTMEQPLDALREARRVLTDEGRLGVLAYVADGPIDDEDVPEGNHFPTAPELDDLLGRAGFAVVDKVEGSTLPDAPVEWTETQAALDRTIRDRHGDDPRWSVAKDQEQQFADLLEREALRVVLLRADPA